MLYTVKSKSAVLNFNKIYVRHPLVYKNKEILDINLFKNVQYFIEHPKWDKTTIYLQLKISDSLHNLFINNKKKYHDSYTRYVTLTEQSEHSVDNFIKLYNNFSLSKLEKNKALLLRERKLFRGEKFIVLDGVHRLTIYYNKINDKEIKSAYFDLNQLYYLYVVDLKKYQSKIIRKLNKTKKNNFYNGWFVNRTIEGGYHSFNTFNLDITGQRNNKLRIKEFSKYIDFTDKIIADFGCSTGGILYHIDNAREYIGIDYDKSSIKSALYIKKLIQKNNKLLSAKYSFFERDFDKIEIQELDLILPKNIDISFLLSMGSWVKSWKQLYEYVYVKSKIIVLEINNISEGVEQLEFFKNLGSNIELILDNSDDDITNNTGRKTYKITKEQVLN